MLDAHLRKTNDVTTVWVHVLGTVYHCEQSWLPELILIYVTSCVRDFICVDLDIFLKQKFIHTWHRWECVPARGRKRFRVKIFVCYIFKKYLI